MTSQDILPLENNIEPMQVAEEKVYTASQWQLMWWRFKKHKIAVVSLIILILAYMIAMFADFVAPHNPARYTASLSYAPPMQVYLFDETEDGRIWFRPHVFGYTSERNTETYALDFVEDPEGKHPIRLFTRGDEYELWGLISTDIHLFGVEDLDTPLLLLGADQLGRDLLSRIIYGARVSLSIGLIGVVLSFFLGIFLGGISGYYGGIVDMIIQRTIEIIRSIPAIPLWLTLSAALPVDWSLTRRYFAITIILSLLGWIGIARVVRGKFLSLREEEFVLAAKLSGTNEIKIIFIHLVPSFFSDLIARLTLLIPNMILAETALSFLGLGLSDPVISWGVLLQSSQQISIVALYPWLMLPALAVIIVVLAFNFVGDGLRDAADPYTR
ncbi:MAG: ABC transporter permease [Aggregatilineales bacterium]